MFGHFVYVVLFLFRWLLDGCIACGLLTRCLLFLRGLHVFGVCVYCICLVISCWCVDCLVVEFGCAFGYGVVFVVWVLCLRVASV